MTMIKTKKVVYTENYLDANNLYRFNNEKKQC